MSESTSSPATRSSDRAMPRLNHPGFKASIEYLHVSAIRAYGRRLRKPSQALQEKLEASIDAFNLVLPLLVDRDGVLIDGHALLEAAKALGISEVPVVRATHLDEAQVKALRLALNRLPELNTWDEAGLALEFKELLEIDLTLDLSFDLAITGFSHPEIDQLIEIQTMMPSRGPTTARPCPASAMSGNSQITGSSAAMPLTIRPIGLCSQTSGLR